MTEMFKEFFMDLVKSEKVVGMTVKSIHSTGPNRSQPITMQFTGFDTENERRRIHYILYNPNIEKYNTPKDFVFNKEFFVNAVNRPDHAVRYFITERVGVVEPQWEL